MAQTSRNNLQFIRVTQSNVDTYAAGMSELERAVWKRDLDPRYWGWRYFENPTRRSSTVLALRGGRIVGKMGEIHLPVVIQGQRHIASLVEGLSVLPAERSWDCLRGLIMACFQERKRDSVFLAFGFATKHWMGFHDKLGLRTLGRCPIWFGLLNLNRILRRRSIPGVLADLGGMAGLLARIHRTKIPLSRVEIRPFERFDMDINDLWNELEPRQRVSVVKDAAYLRWRYDSCPGYSYKKLGAFGKQRIEGFAVYGISPERRNGYLLELMAHKDDLNLLHQLTLDAVEAMDREGAGFISASFPPGSAAATGLERLGFRSWGTFFWNIKTVLWGPWPEAFPKASGDETFLKGWDFSLGDWLYH